MEKTIKNLAAAFIGESQARNRYSMYASIAKKEGFEQIAAIFTETAEQEKEHAKWLMQMINDLKAKSSDDYSEITLEAGCPTIVATTIENLKAAIAGENHEHTNMYPDFAKVADEEGLVDIAKRLRNIAVAEAHHEERYQKLLVNIEAGQVYKRDTEQSWVCRECGYEHKGLEAPDTCPACGHPQSYYQLKNEIY
ncbi:rubrerythrin family protein [Candidatus Parcubacteria bacterium]|nr:MAG: rubrerythrin family protein [Candidatus Parcubacteria bacterium]